MPLFDGIEEFKNVSPALQWAIFIVGVLIAIVAVISVCVSIWLPTNRWYGMEVGENNPRKLLG